MDISDKTINQLGYLPADRADYRDTRIGFSVLSSNDQEGFEIARANYKRFGDIRILLYYRIQYLRQGRLLPPLLANFIGERVEAGELWSVKGSSGLSWQVLFDFVCSRWPNNQEDRGKYMLRLCTMINLVPHEVRIDASAVIAYHEWSRAAGFHKSCVMGDYLYFRSKAELCGRSRSMEVRMGGLDGSLFVVNKDHENPSLVKVNMSNKYFETLRRRYFPCIDDDK